VNNAAERAAVSLIPAKLSGDASVACGPAEFTTVAGISISATIGTADSARRLAHFMAALSLLRRGMIFGEDRYRLLGH
jgi:hypothetical protein